VTRLGCGADGAGIGIAAVAGSFAGTGCGGVSSAFGQMGKPLMHTLSAMGSTFAWLSGIE
jgi:hypothetical protein